MRLHPSKLLVVLGLPLALAACSAPLTIEATADESTLSSELDWAGFSLGPGDILRVSVHNHPELSTPLANTASGAVGTRVDQEGFLSLPLAGPIAVGGLSVRDARTAVREACAVYVQEPSVDLSVVEYASRRFHLFGEVNQAGTFVMDRPLNLYQALGMGSGFTPRARREQIVLLRGGPDDLQVHVFDAESPDAGGMFAIEPDDILFVRRSGKGRFADEILPILSGISSSLSSVATVLLIEDRLDQ